MGPAPSPRQGSAPSPRCLPCRCSCPSTAWTSNPLKVREVWGRSEHNNVVLWYVCKSKIGWKRRIHNNPFSHLHNTYIIYNMKHRPETMLKSRGYKTLYNHIFGASWVRLISGIQYQLRRVEVASTNFANIN